MDTKQKARIFPCFFLLKIFKIFWFKQVAIKKLCQRHIKCCGNAQNVCHNSIVCRCIKDVLHRCFWHKRLFVQGIFCHIFFFQQMGSSFCYCFAHFHMYMLANIIKINSSIYRPILIDLHAFFK